MLLLSLMKLKMCDTFCSMRMESIICVLTCFVNMSIWSDIDMLFSYYENNMLILLLSQHCCSTCDPFILCQSVSVEEYVYMFQCFSHGGWYFYSVDNEMIDWISLDPVQIIR